MPKNIYNENIATSSKFVLKEGICSEGKGASNQIQLAERKNGQMRSRLQCCSSGHQNNLYNNSNGLGQFCGYSGGGGRVWKKGRKGYNMVFWWSWNLSVFCLWTIRIPSPWLLWRPPCRRKRKPQRRISITDVNLKKHNGNSRSHLKDQWILSENQRPGLGFQ